MRVKSKACHTAAFCEVIEFGLNSRTTGVTGANVDSSRPGTPLKMSMVHDHLQSLNVHKLQRSRSHAILQISLKDLESKEAPASLSKKPEPE